MISKPKRTSQRLNRRKETLLKKAYEMGEFCEVDVALILRIRKTGRYITFKSVDLESFPPSMEQIQLTYPIPINMLPHDIEAKLRVNTTPDTT
ncbi:hypothetical protein BDZ45DRAFT_709734 [Acephala macrosclerotiorum]|nr:hypothetical protein BDZ45DRAFT_709734 [Acephala macrosclerotiorum]